MILRVMHRAAAPLASRRALAYGALVLGLGLVAIRAGLAHATEAGRITVKRVAVVNGPTIRLGDLAALEGGATALGDVELGPAPTAGAPRRLDGEAILAGRGNAVEWNGIDDWVAGVHLHSRNGRVWFHSKQTLIRRAI